MGASRRRRASVTALVASLAVVVGLLGSAGVASAAPADEQLASTNPQNNTPRVLDGRVQAIVRVGDTVLVGGTFTQVQEAAANSPILSRSGLFAFDAATGVVSTSFVPQLAARTGEVPGVDALVLTADQQSVYVGGDYRTINGSGPARLQALKLSDGTRLASFANPALNSRVYDLKLSGGQLFVAGSFSAVGGVERRGMATFNATTGALTDKVTLPFTGTAAGFGVTTVRKIDITPAGDRLIALGNFDSVGGQSRLQIAMLNVAGAAATVDGWRTTRFGGADCSAYFDTYMRDVDFAPDGSFFLVVTTGGWGAPPRLCDSVSRWQTYSSGDQNPAWVDYTGGDTFWAIEVTGPVAYAGGHFRWLNNTYTTDGRSAGPGAVSREGLAAIDTRNGLPFSWNPTRTRGVGVFDFFVTQTELWAGSDTAWWAGEKRDRLAAFPWAGGLPLRADRLGTVPGDVVQLDADAVTGADATSRYLTGPGVPEVTTLATGGITWSNVRGAVMVDDTLYTGWSDGTFKQQSFDGNTFGAQSAVPLNGGSFGTDLSSTTARVTSMFYDPRTGRLYYTRANTTGKNGTINNDGGLYYRYFTPESGVVGAQRWDDLTSASRTAIDAGNIRGAFLSNGWLYYVTSAGALRRIQFTATGFSGASELVNSAAGTDWRAKGLFLSTQPSIKAPNNPPTAQFTQSCIGLSCTFDASGSSDSDGSIASYSWDFGDGSPVEGGVSSAHVFASANSYPVTLTVTDNDGASTQSQVQVSVAPIATSIAFRGATQYEGKQLKFHKWTLPGSVQAGDTLVMAVTGGRQLDAGPIADPGVVRDANQVALPGWSEVADVTDDDDIRTVIYTKTATAQDAGATVGVLWTAGATEVSVRTVVSTVAYSGVASVGPVATGGETAGSKKYAHSTPGVSVPGTGDWVVSYWSDKSASTLGWTPPAGQVSRTDPVSYFDPAAPTTVRVTGLLTDDGAATIAGARAGLVATADGNSTSATMATLVLQAQ